MAFVSHGVKIGIRVSSPEILDRIERLLPLYSKPARGRRVNSLYSLIVSGSKVGSKTRRVNILYAEVKGLARTRDTDKALEALEDHLQLYVAEHAPRRVFVHAGVVGWRGKAIVIPGRTHTGKSTLVKALVEAGATYYSDEYAVLDKRGRVHPYARPLSMRPIGGGRPTKVAPEAHLLEEHVTLPGNRTRYTRREVLRTLRRVAGISLLLPVIEWVRAPLAAAQMSNCVDVDTCEKVLVPPQCYNQPICGEANECCGPEGQPPECKKHGCP